MRLTAQIGEYEMDQVILDLGSDVNTLPKQTWERMGRLMLQWSPIQRRMANQQKIIPMGRLYGVAVDIEGKSDLANFEVIKNANDNNPYPKLLRIDWAFDMDAVIILKKRRLTFEKKALRFIMPLDPIGGECYAEPVHDYEEVDDLDQIYKIMKHDEDWINPLQTDESRGIETTPVPPTQMKSSNTGKTGCMRFLRYTAT